MADVHKVEVKELTSDVTSGPKRPQRPKFACLHLLSLKSACNLERVEDRAIRVSYSLLHTFHLSHGDVISGLTTYPMWQMSSFRHYEWFWKWISLLNSGCKIRNIYWTFEGKLGHNINSPIVTVGLTCSLAGEIGTLPLLIIEINACSLWGINDGRKTCIRH